jgi:hypothetical protein
MENDKKGVKPKDGDAKPKKGTKKPEQGDAEKDGKKGKGSKKNTLKELQPNGR